MKADKVLHREKLLSPKLRFTEFKNPWAFGKLGTYIEQYRERVPANTKIPILTSSRTGLYKQSDYFDNRELANEGEYGVVPRGYFTYRHMSDDSTFKFNINNLCDKGAVSKEYPVFTTKKMDSVFLHHKLNYGNELKRFAAAQKLGGTRVRLYYNKLKELEFNIPTLPEQQKIATFLSAVDEKIQQLTHKKELLEQYKKGVMQQLFTGKLRFKDDNGKAFPKWKEKKLGLLTDVVVGGTPSTAIPEYWNGQIPWLSSGELKNGGIHEAAKFITTLGFKNSSTKLMPKETVLLAMTGATLGRTGFLNFESSGNQSIAGFLPNQSFNSKYLFYNLQFNFQLILSYAGGAAQPGINKNTIENLLLSFPLIEEQKKIANYLSNIDNKIESITKQIAQTRIFKKGLLQQMFI